MGRSKLTIKYRVMDKESEKNALAGRLMRIYNLAIVKDEHFRRRLATILDLIEKEADFIEIFFKNEEVAEILHERVSKLFSENSRKKICIIGESRIPHDQIYGIAKTFGIPEPENHLELHLAFESIKNEVQFEKFRHNDNYVGIIIGPLPHSITGLEGANITKMITGEEGFPPRVMAITENEGTHLKLTKSSLRKALRELILKIAY